MSCTEINISEIENSNSNFILHGKPEYGKSTLLRQIALHLTSNSISQNQNITVPILFNFSDLKPSHRVLKTVKNAMSVEPEGFTILQLAQEGLLTIMVDDINFNDTVNINKLYELIREYPKNRYIFTTLTPINEYSLPITQEIDTKVSWQHVDLKPFTRKNMRSFVEKWDKNGNLDKDLILNRLIEEFVNINIPITAANGTILLTIYEEQRAFRPINRAVLIDNFMEHILEKRAVKEVVRVSFDYKNKVDVLSNLAEYMARNNKYILSNSEVEKVIRGYLTNIGLPQSTPDLIEEFIYSRILIKKSGNISFRYRAFLEYFIASQMKFNNSFRKWVLDEAQYLSFINELLYYAGIVRNDKDLITLVGHRFKELTDNFLEILQWSPNISLIENINLTPSKDPSDNLDSLDILESQLKSPPLTAEEKDDILEAELPRDAEGRQEVFRPELSDIGQKWTTALFLYSGLLKNMELIPVQLKKEHLDKIFDSWGVFTMISMLIVPHIAKHRKIRVNGVLYEVNMPRNYTEKQIAQLIYTDLPNSISRALTASLGTEKLELRPLHNALNFR